MQLLQFGTVLILGLTFTTVALAAPQDGPTAPKPGIDSATVTKQQAPQQQAPEATHDVTKTNANGSPGHIFFVLPAFHVEYLKNVPPLTPMEKWNEVVEETYDPMGLALSAAEVLMLEHKKDGTGFCDYGSEIGGFSKCYGSALLDANLSGVLGDYLFPVLLKQDPRYFRLGTGSVFSRTFYALTQGVIVTRNDHGGTSFDSSQMAGTITAGFISNLYYPKADQGTSLTVSRIEIDLIGTAIGNLEAEYWPDIDHFLFHRHDHAR
ncbi:MAG TPA: hypothetical protein VIC54_12050 [Terriglobales bacterium]|jgi:hypothetical protein